MISLKRWIMPPVKYIKSGKGEMLILWLPKPYNRLSSTISHVSHTRAVWHVLLLCFCALLDSDRFCDDGLPGKVSQSNLYLPVCSSFISPLPEFCPNRRHRGHGLLPLSMGQPFTTDRNTNIYSSVCYCTTEFGNGKNEMVPKWRREWNYQIHLVVPQSVGRLLCVAMVVARGLWIGSM